MESEGKSILVIDDEKSVLLVVATALTQFGYFIVKAQNGTEGIEWARIRQFDLVLLDYTMPGYNGLETADRLLQISPGIRIVIMTGLGGTTPDNVGQRFTVLSKPFTVQTLAKTVSEALNGTSQHGV